MRKITEKLAMGSAECVFVMSEKLRDHYQAKYPKLNMRIIRHSVDRTKYHLRHDDKERFDPTAKPVTIVFTGMIYGYQIDAIQNCAKAVNELDGVCFHIYTQGSREYLEGMGVCGKNVFYFGYLSNDDICRVQNNADILFLPMSFGGKGVNKDIVKTASPSKIGEYLAAGRPILIHAPNYSYVAWYASKYGFGLVVEDQDTNSLIAAIMRLMCDPQLKAKLILNAGKTVELHDISRVSHEFIKGLGMNN